MAVDIYLHSQDTVRFWVLCEPISYLVVETF